MFLFHVCSAFFVCKLFSFVLKFTMRCTLKQNFSIYCLCHSNLKLLEYTDCIMMSVDIDIDIDRICMVYGTHPQILGTFFLLALFLWFSSVVSSYLLLLWLLLFASFNNNVYDKRKKRVASCSIQSKYIWFYMWTE